MAHLWRDTLSVLRAGSFLNLNNGDDLDEGDRTCSSDQFTCQEGQCVPANYRCDHVKDCVDNSDENNCSKILYPHMCNYRLIQLQINLVVGAVR